MAVVEVTPGAAEEIAALPLPIVTRMHGLLERLKEWPAVSGAKALRGDLAGHYRMRTGDYRLQFRVVTERKKVTRVGMLGRRKRPQEQVVEVVIHTVIVERAGHRDGFYDD